VADLGFHDKGVGAQKSYLTGKVKIGEPKKNTQKKGHQNSSKKFISKLTRAKRERKFSTNFQTFEWIFPQHVQRNHHLNTPSAKVRRLCG